MSVEIDWFKICILLIGGVFTIYKMFFDKNNQVFEVMLQNQQTQLTNQNKLIEKQDERIDSIEKDFTKMETLFEKLAKDWDKLTKKYEAREAALLESNRLKDEELKLKSAELQSSKSLQEYQKKAFKASLENIVTIQKEAFDSITKHETAKVKTKTG